MNAHRLAWLALGALACVLLLGLSNHARAASPPPLPTGSGVAPLATDTATGSATPTVTIPDTATDTATGTPPMTTVTWTPTSNPTATATGSPTAIASVTPPCGLAWRPVTVPNVGGLLNVAALSPNDVWIAGEQGVIHWDGSMWTLVTLPFSGPVNGLAAPATNDVWVMPGTAGSTPYHWDGSNWTHPLLSYPYATFFGIMAAAPHTAWIEGSTSQPPDFRGPVLDHWDGSTWAYVSCCPIPPVQRPAGGCQIFTDITGAGTSVPDDAWLTGTYSTTCGPPVTQSFVSHCTPAGCSDVTAQVGAVRYFAGRASNDVWAVGGTTSSLIRHWDGTSWSTVSAPNIGRLTAVTARAANDVWAGNATGFLHWDGASWTQVPSSYPFLGLFSISAAAPDDVWAVGVDSSYQGMLLHYSDPTAFVDVPTSQPFYPYIQWMACRAIISGYTCGGPGEPCPGTYFRPGLNVTRGQLLKMTALAAGWPLLTPPNASRTFEDVPDSSPFYTYIETGAAHGIISGYTCGGPGEPCVLPGNRPYFRAGNPITRSQISKVIALAREYTIVPPPGTQTFHDVPATDPFYGYIEAMAAHSIVSGYTCGQNPNEPCDPQQRPYFRAGANATRGQVSKFVTLAYGGP